MDESLIAINISPRRYNQFRETEQRGGKTSTGKQPRSQQFSTTKAKIIRFKGFASIEEGLGFEGKKQFELDKLDRNIQ